MAKLLPFLILLLLALVVISAPAFSRPVVWVAPSLERVGPTAPRGEAREIALYAAKGEYESFQIIVRADGGNLSQVNVTGRFSGGPQVTLYREHYVHVPRGSKDWVTNRNRPQGPGWYPDALLPFTDPNGIKVPAAAPFKVRAGRNQPVWVDVFVPRGTPAGTHRGAFTVTSDQGKAEVRVNLRVWNFALPVKPALKSCILYWPQENRGIGRRLKQPDEELLRHRLMPMGVDPTEEHRLMNDFGLNATNAGFWSGADQHTAKMRPAPSEAEFRRAVAQHEPGLYLYNYTADEIGSNPALYPRLKQWARHMHQAGIRNLVTMKPTPELYTDGSGTGRSAVDIWVLLPKMYDAARPQVAAVRRKGDEIWSYNATVQDAYSPKWEIDFAPINYRIQPGFINQSLGFTGLLYWRVDNWTADPWEDVMTMQGYPGEGLLVYPGDKIGLSGVVPSMRLKYLRDGVDDYDYIELLKSRGQEKWALTVVRRIGADWSHWTRDPQALEAARRELGERLSELARAPR